MGVAGWNPEPQLSMPGVYRLGSRSDTVVVACNDASEVLLDTAGAGSYYDSLSDSELMSMREALFAPPSMDELRAAMRPMTTVHLRLPHGDPDQLLPGAKERLMQEVARA
jgi:hypothetical protein